MEKRNFDFSTLGGTQELYVVLCPALCVLAFTRVKLTVRVHALTMTSGQLLRFFVWSTLPSDEDPTQEFVEPSALTTADIESTTPVPSLVTETMGYDPATYLKISLRASQTSAPTTFLATLSACVILRSD